MDEVAAGDLEIIVTKNGHPVSRLVPCQDARGSMFGIDRGQLRIIGGVVEPLDEDDWEAASVPSATDECRRYAGNGKPER